MFSVATPSFPKIVPCFGLRFIRIGSYARPSLDKRCVFVSARRSPRAPRGVRDAASVKMAAPRRAIRPAARCWLGRRTVSSASTASRSPCDERSPRPLRPVWGELPCGCSAGAGAELSRSGQFLRLLPRTVSQATCFFSCKVSRTSPTNE
jgi:hypothetical protein